MYVTQAYRILVSLKLHGAEASKVTPEQIAEAKTVVAESAASETDARARALKSKVLRDLAKAGR